MPGLADLIRGHEGWRIRGEFGRGPCPSCRSRTSGWATINDEGNPRVGCWAGCDYRDVRPYFGLDDGGRFDATPFMPPPKLPGRPVAPDMVEDADALDSVYRVFARHLFMDSTRRRSVLGRDRGIPPGIRAKMPPLLTAMPQDPAGRRRMRQAIVDDLKGVAPDAFLRRVPELAGRRGDSYVVLGSWNAARYLEPWRDERGRTVALRAYMGRRSKGAKYLTHRGRTGPLVHFAFGSERERANEVPWIFTEGFMKAEVAAHHFGCVAAALPGVSARGSWQRAIEAKECMAPDAPSYVAFDAEVWTTRPDIAEHALGLGLAIQRLEGRKAGYAAWHAEADEEGNVAPKGIDDAIVAGVPVHLLERDGFASFLGPALDRWERRAAA